jgi:hypothetical protein
MSLRDAIALTDVEISESLETLQANPIADQQAWARIREAMECRRKLVQTEVRHLVMSGQMITAEEVLSLMTVLVASVGKHVKDPAERAALSRDMHGVLTKDSGLRGAWERLSLPEPREGD